MAISWSAGYKVRVSSSGPLFGILPHIPDSKPTEKQLESLLKATDRTAVGEDASIGGRTFIAVRERFHPRVMCKKMSEIEPKNREKFKQALSGIVSRITLALDGGTVASWLRTQSVRAGGITGYVRMLLTAMPSSSAILGGLCGARWSVTAAGAPPAIGFRGWNYQQHKLERWPSATKGMNASATAVLGSAWTHEDGEGRDCER